MSQHLSSTRLTPDQLQTVLLISISVSTTTKTFIENQHSDKARKITNPKTAQLLMTHSMAPLNESHGIEVDTVTEAAFPTPSSAAHRVLSTTRLLCNITAHLPLEQVFAAAVVCREWRKTLAADLATQQALFLKPREVREVIAPDRYILDLEHPIPIDECTIIGEFNPWVYDICGCVQLGNSLHLFVNLESLHIGGLWREMFVTQPPCKTITISMYSQLDGNISHNSDLSCEAGIKMGELFDFIDKEMRLHPECRGSGSYVKNFDTGERARDLPWATTRCEVRNGEVYRPPQLSKLHSPQGSDYTQDLESNDGDGGSQGAMGYGGGYKSDSEGEYSDDDEDPDEFAAEQADEANQYFRW